jgi:hypothetical protein
VPKKISDSPPLPARSPALGPSADCGRLWLLNDIQAIVIVNLFTYPEPVIETQNIGDSKVLIHQRSS